MRGTLMAAILAVAATAPAADAARANRAGEVRACPERREVAAGPEAKAARRRWALTKMDEMANERLRCRERFKARGQVEACEAEFTRRFREYNEIYLEASRD
jgi:hypothetical protein